MNDPIEYLITQDKLRFFVSSRLAECKDERSAARKAIMSLNHEPILFEHIGARPNSPRMLYLSRLHDSQAMVAIYRIGYGYIDNAHGMTISGLEDEFTFAQEKGISTLIYVSKHDSGRDLVWLLSLTVHRARIPSITITTWRI